MNRKLPYEHSLGNNPRIAVRVARRKEYEKWKQSPDFMQWRKLQWKIQQGKCAWCLYKMNRDFYNVHVDHCLPLYHEGTNKKDNLVLSHARCNMKKWIRVDGMPQWIKNRMLRHRRYVMIEKQKRLFNELMESQYIVDDQEEIAHSLSWIV
jgi:5-methylcytosine-specific restriction endonuclease McrA